MRSGCDRAEHIRHSLAPSPIIAGDAKIPLRQSMGAASSVEWAVLDGEDLIRKADEAIESRRKKPRDRLAACGFRTGASCRSAYDCLGGTVSCEV